MPTEFDIQGYLEGDYLSGPYLGEIEGDSCGMQAAFVVGKRLGLQARGVINAAPRTGMQVSTYVIVNQHTGMQGRPCFLATTATGMQIWVVGAKHLGSQATFVIYNTTQLRIMTTFPSRGALVTGGTNAWGQPQGTGKNWTASSTASGDFSVNNLNTDIEEQVYRTAAKTGIIFTCDTERPQGVFIDTLMIKNHNLTKSATVVMQQSNDSSFASVGESTTLNVELGDLFYIAPSLPHTGYKYVRFLVDDATNPAAYLQFGMVIFGAAKIFPKGEGPEDPISFGKKHFKDTIETEGFTNVSNDRAVRKVLKLDFKQLDEAAGGYALLEEVETECKTSLRALWIPQPRTASRFAVYGKLSDMLQPQHTDNSDYDEDGTQLSAAHYIDVSLEVDESK